MEDAKLLKGIFYCVRWVGGCPPAVFQADSVNRYQTMMNFVSLRGSLAEKRYFKHQIVKVVDCKSHNINHLWEVLKDVVGNNSISSEVIELVHKLKKKRKKESFETHIDVFFSSLDVIAVV